MDYIQIYNIQKYRGKLYVNIAFYDQNIFGANLQATRKVSRKDTKWKKNKLKTNRKKLNQIDE